MRGPMLWVVVDLACLIGATTFVWFCAWRLLVKTFNIQGDR